MNVIGKCIVVLTLLEPVVTVTPLHIQNSVSVAALPGRTNDDLYSLLQAWVHHALDEAEAELVVLNTAGNEEHLNPKHVQHIKGKKEDPGTQHHHPSAANVSIVAVPCEDTQNTGFQNHYGRAVACSVLAPYCTKPGYATQTQRACPSTCGVCEATSSDIGDKSLTKNANGNSTVHCSDSEVTGFVVGSKPLPCSELASFCKDEVMGDRLRHVCPVTCQTCPQVEVQAQDEKPKCADKSSMCSVLVSHCTRPEFTTKIMGACPVSCGQCKDERLQKKRKKTRPPCHDKAYTGFNNNYEQPATCSALVQFCSHSEYGEPVQKACPVSCGSCPEVLEDEEPEESKTMTAPTISGGKAQLVKDILDKFDTNPDFGFAIGDLNEILVGWDRTSVELLFPLLDQNGDTTLNLGEFLGWLTGDYDKEPGNSTCADRVNTGLTVNGKPVQCPTLFAYCQYSDFSHRVKKACPRTCGVCKEDLEFRNLKLSRRENRSVRDESNTTEQIQDTLHVVETSKGQKKTLVKWSSVPPQIFEEMNAHDEHPAIYLEPLENYSISEQATDPLHQLMYKNFSSNHTQANMAEKTNDYTQLLGTSWIGCFHDDDTQRTLERQITGNHTTTTCLRACSKFAYIALRNQGECWCSSKLENSDKSYDVNSHCGEVCAGESNLHPVRYCGGLTTSAVYKVEILHFNLFRETDVPKNQTAAPVPMVTNDASSKIAVRKENSDSEDKMVLPFPCEDSLSSGFQIHGKVAPCSMLEQWCSAEDYKYAAGIKTACPMTCGLCSKFSDCKDQPYKIAPDGHRKPCRALADLCQDEEYGTEIQAACPQTCQKCPGVTYVTHAPTEKDQHRKAIAAAPCADWTKGSFNIRGKKKSCQDLASHCTDSGVASDMWQYCPQTCGICSTAAKASVAAVSGNSFAATGGASAEDIAKEALIRTRGEANASNMEPIPVSNEDNSSSTAKHPGTDLSPNATMEDITVIMPQTVATESPPAPVASVPAFDGPAPVTAVPASGTVAPVASATAFDSAAPMASVPVSNGPEPVVSVPAATAIAPTTAAPPEMSAYDPFAVPPSPLTAKVPHSSKSFPAHIASELPASSDDDGIDEKYVVVAIDEAIAAFSELDINGDGVLDLSEFCMMFDQIFRGQDCATIKALLSNMDNNIDGKLRLDEFDRLFKSVNEEAACADMEKTGFNTTHGETASCYDLAPHCNDPSYGSDLQKACPMTCGMCSPPKDEQEVGARLDNSDLHSVVSVADPCIDKSDTGIVFNNGKIAPCSLLAPSCDDPEFGDQIKTTCAKTCGVCKSLKQMNAIAIKPPHRCMDLLDTGFTKLDGTPESCTTMAASCDDPDVAPLIQPICPKTCKVCPENKITGFTTDFNRRVNVESIFDRLDANSDGALIENEFSHLFNLTLGRTVPVDMFMSAADGNGDKALQFNEFNAWLTMGNEDVDVGGSGRTLPLIPSVIPVAQNEANATTSAPTATTPQDDVPEASMVPPVAIPPQAVPEPPAIEEDRTGVPPAISEEPPIAPPAIDVPAAPPPISQESPNGSFDNPEASSIGATTLSPDPAIRPNDDIHVTAPPLDNLPDSTTSRAPLEASIYDPPAVPTGSSEVADTSNRIDSVEAMPQVVEVANSTDSEEAMPQASGMANTVDSVEVADTANMTDSVEVMPQAADMANAVDSVEIADTANMTDSMEVMPQAADMANAVDSVEVADTANMTDSVEAMPQIVDAANTTDSVEAMPQVVDTANTLDSVEDVTSNPVDPTTPAVVTPGHHDDMNDLEIDPDDLGTLQGNNSGDSKLEDMHKLANLTTATIGTKAEASDCEDKTVTGFATNGVALNCRQLARLCRHRTYGAQIQKSCPKTCGACSTVKVLKPGCADLRVTGLALKGRSANCRSLARFCNTIGFSAQVRSACPKTCGVCEEMQ